MTIRGWMPVLVGASLAIGMSHSASAQKIGDVINGLAGHPVVPMQDHGSDRDAYERGRQDAYRDRQARDDDRVRRDRTLNREGYGRRDDGLREDGGRYRDDDRRRRD